MVIDIFDDIKKPSTEFKKSRSPNLSKKSQVGESDKFDTKTDDDSSGIDKDVSKDGTDIEGEGEGIGGQKGEGNGVFLGSVSISGKGLMSLLFGTKVTTQWFDIERDAEIDDISDSATLNDVHDMNKTAINPDIIRDLVSVTPNIRTDLSLTPQTDPLSMAFVEGGPNHVKVCFLFFLIL